MQYDVKEDQMLTPMQSATTQTVSLIYDPQMMNDTETISETSYPIRENSVYVASQTTRVPSTDRMEVLRKSTLV
jgi:hypothetical protein